MLIYFKDKIIIPVIFLTEVLLGNSQFSQLQETASLVTCSFEISTEATIQRKLL